MKRGVVVVTPGRRGAEAKFPSFGGARETRGGHGDAGRHSGGHLGLRFGWSPARTHRLRAMDRKPLPRPGCMVAPLGDVPARCCAGRFPWSRTPVTRKWKQKYRLGPPTVQDGTYVSNNLPRTQLGCCILRNLASCAQNMAGHRTIQNVSIAVMVTSH